MDWRRPCLHLYVESIMYVVALLQTRRRSWPRPVNYLPRQDQTASSSHKTADLSYEKPRAHLSQFSCVHSSLVNTLNYVSSTFANTRNHPWKKANFPSKIEKITFWYSLFDILPSCATFTFIIASASGKMHSPGIKIAPVMEHRRTFSC